MRKQLIDSEQLIEVLAETWGRFKAVDSTRTEYGLEFGKACFELREASKAIGQRKKDEGFAKALEDLGIPRPTAYKWIDRYESVCLRIDKPNIHFSSASSEWYTPVEIIDRVQMVLGGIDLDPCCNPGEPIVPAEVVFREEDDGLKQLWHGSVYMNPPYGDAIGEWVKKLVTDYAMGITQKAIALVPARVDTQWFKYFRDFPICFISGRLKFGQAENSAPFPSAVVYVGKDYPRFYGAFSDVGDIWIRFRGEGPS